VRYFDPIESEGWRARALQPSGVYLGVRGGVAVRGQRIGSRRISPPQRKSSQRKSLAFDNNTTRTGLPIRQPVGVD